MMFSNFLKLLGIITLAIIIHILILGKIGITINKKYYEFNGILSITKNYWRDKNDK